LKAQLNHSVDHNRATQFLKERLAKIPNVKTDPAPDVEILEFNLAGPVLAVGSYCHMDHYWQVYFDTHRVFANHSALRNFQFREQHLAIRNQTGNGANA
jgi:small conductance mechanosensitive channel